MGWRYAKRYSNLETGNLAGGIVHESPKKAIRLRRQADMITNYVKFNVVKFNRLFDASDYAEAYRSTRPPVRHNHI